MPMKTLKIFLFTIVLLFTSCSPATETVIIDRKVQVTVPAIYDSTMQGEIKHATEEQKDTLVQVFQSLPDSVVIESVKEVITAKGDKVKVYVNYKPKTNTFTVDIPSFQVDTVITDTTKITVKKEITLYEKLGYAAAGIIVFVIGYIIYRVKRG